MNSMNDNDDVYALRARITKQASLVKQMKKDGADATAISTEVATLLSLRSTLADIEKSNIIENPFNKKSFDELMLRKMFVVPSFEIHNGPAGLFDYGPPCSALKANVLSLWRRHFIYEESMLEMECTNLTPSNVLATSGHVERFTDFMVRDTITGECHRADKLLEDEIDKFIQAHPELTEEEVNEHRIIQRQADAFTQEELGAMIKKYNIKSPTNGVNDLTDPFPFNLMFKTTIGPEGVSVGYLRPETAQGLFVNFRRLLDFNQQRMPFAAAQIGTGFRNEIAPRNGLLRVREFCMAEIEHFVHPEKKSHPKFKRVADKSVVLFSADAQLGSGRTEKMTIGQAVSSGLVANETLGYFMARTQMFLEKIGVLPDRMRFRQHLRTEMAHYACDCWDMEIHLSYGWIECVGHADRACYDLQQHSAASGVPMMASEKLAEPVLVERLVVEPNRKKIGPKFKKEQKEVIKALEELDDDAVEALQKDLENLSIATVNGFQIEKDMVDIRAEKKNMHEVKFTPSVIEPSFGIGRVLYSVLEHSFMQREGDEQRCVMMFPPCVAPIKVGIFRLLNNPQFDPIVERIRENLQNAGVVCKVDSSSGTVGRRYARADELGIPFGLTVDFQSLVDKAVTVRERNTMTQLRVPISALVGLLRDLCEELVTWEVVMTRYPVFYSGEDGSDDSDSKAAAPVSALKVERSFRSAFSRPSVPIV